MRERGSTDNVLPTAHDSFVGAVSNVAWISGQPLRSCTSSRNPPDECRGRERGGQKRCAKEGHWKRCDMTTIYDARSNLHAGAVGHPKSDNRARSTEQELHSCLVNQGRW